MNMGVRFLFGFVLSTSPMVSVFADDPGGVPQDAELSSSMKFPRFYGVNVADPLFQSGGPGDSLVYAFKIENVGSNPDTYSITIESRNGWHFADSSPGLLSLQPNHAFVTEVIVKIPEDANIGDKDSLILTVRSTDKNRENVLDSGLAKTSVVQKDK